MQQPPPSLLNFYEHDSFEANYKANNAASVAEHFLWWQLSMFAIYHEQLGRDVCQVLCRPFAK